MYGGDYFLSTITGDGVAGAEEDDRDLRALGRLLFPGGVCCHGHVHCVRCGGRAYEALGLPRLCRGHDRLHLPHGRQLDLGRQSGFRHVHPGRSRLSRLRRLRHCAHGRRRRGLAGVLLLGARKGKYREDGSVVAIPGANLPLATLGTFILWLGWFGFNGGSVLATASVESANAVAVVFMNTNGAAAGGLIGALLTARLLFGKADLTMALNGALAGLVAITAGPDTPSALQAVIFGAVGGVLVVFSIITLDKLKIDDPVGAISVHGVVGLLGLLLVPVTNGENSSFTGQLIGAGTIFGWVFITSLIVFFILKMIIGIRVGEEEEYEGVDLSECGLEAYPEFVTAK
jgi:Amt family ammonium transporter